MVTDVLNLLDLKISVTVAKLVNIVFKTIEILNCLFIVYKVTGLDSAYS